MTRCLALMGTSWSPSVTVTSAQLWNIRGLHQSTALAPLIVYGLFTMSGVLMDFRLFATCCGHGLPEAGSGRHCRFFTRALDHKLSPIEVSADHAAAYPRVLDELVPAACHAPSNTETTRSKPITDG